MPVSPGPTNHGAVPMNPTRAPLITIGQLYLNEEVNDYLIVTGKAGDQISYAGKGFKGMCEDQTFIERFLPVDPLDVDQDELKYLVSLCSKEIEPKIGFILS